VLSLPYTDANYERIEKEFKHATSTLDHYLWLKSVAFRGVIGRGLMNKTNGVIKSTRTIINQKINVPPNARITNLDYKKILEEYKDNPEAVLYCDPPYCNSALSSLHNDEYGGITLNKNCLEDLCEFAKTATCKVMIHVPMDGYMYLLARDNPILKISTCYPLNYNANKDKTRLVHHCILQNF
jgi:site-specific DNA-adenine methylase